MGSVDMIIVVCVQVKVKAKELRGKKRDELLKQLEELKVVSIYNTAVCNILHCRSEIR